MKILSILAQLAVVTIALHHATAHATARARNLGEPVLNDPAVRISAGPFNACRVNEDGTVHCWGGNREGQLGDGSHFSRNTPAPVSGITNAIAVSSGLTHGCALIGDGTVRCWGLNSFGQVGDGTTAERLTPVVVTGLTNAVAISAGAFHTCALLGDGTARCWGANFFGQGGDGTATDRLTPVPVSLFGSVVAIAAGMDHTCAVLADGRGYCWGRNNAGQLGDGTTTQRLTPTLVTGLVGAVGIAAGASHACAVMGDGNVRCWGGNAKGQLGDGSTTARLTPVIVSGLPGNVTSVVTTRDTTCVRLADGTARCWGANQLGQVGNGTITPTAPRLTPAVVSGLTGAVAIAAGGAVTCALLADGSARCWGDNVLGSLGNGTFVTSSVPTTVLGGGGTITARDIASGDSHTCAVRANGTVACWGDNTAGQLGDGTTTGKLVPVTVGGLSGAVAVAAGDRHTCAVLVDGTARCWGDNAVGQLGDGTTTRRLTPVPVGGLTQVVSIATGDFHTCALLANGTLRCWGENLTGQVGDGTTTRRFVPVPVATITPIGAPINASVAGISAGREHTCALLVDGTERCWGGGSHGELGNGFFPSRPTPLLVNFITSGVAVAAGDFHTCTVRASTVSINGAPVTSAFCWGANNTGALGDGTVTQAGFPVPVSGLANAIGISAGGAHTCAVLANSTVRCWGDNTAGQIGDGTTTQRLLPVQPQTQSSRLERGGSTLITSTPLGSVTQIATGRRHTCAVISSGGVRCWGENFFGQLGIGTTTNALRPVVVPSFTLNIDPTVGIQHQGRIAHVEILAICEPGQHLHVDVTLLQDGASGHGVGAGACTGTLERYAVTVPSHGPTRFIEGPAQVTAEAILRERGTVEEQQWTRAVTVVAP